MKTSFKITIFLFWLIHFSAYSNNEYSNFEVLYDSLYNEIHYQYFNNGDFSFSEQDRQEIQKLYQLNNLNYSPLNNARIQYLDAIVNFADTLTNYKHVFYLIDEALIVLSKDKHPKEYAKLLLFKAAANIDARMDYVSAYRYLQEVLQLLNETDDPAFIGLTYNYLSMLWSYVGEDENALEYNINCQRIFNDAKLEKTALIMRINGYSILLRMGKQVLPQIKEELTIVENQNDTTIAIFLNMIIGNSYSSSGNLDTAYYYLNKAYIYINEISNPLLSRKCDVMYSIGILFYRMKDYDKASYFLKMTLPYAQQLNLLRYESHIYYLLSEIESSYNNEKEAYEYLNTAIRLRDSLAVQEKTSELQKIKTHTELMSYQQEMQIIKQQSQIKQTRSLLVIAVLLLLVVAISFILLYLNRKKQLHYLKIKQLDQELKNKEIANKLEKIELEKQVEAKEREMATTQLLIIEKNRVLEQMLDTFKPFYKSNDISDKIWREMQKFVSSYSRRDNDWEKSKIHFEKVHPSFFKKLKELFPNITENELRLCAYIRIGMRSKEIAEMLSIDHKSVISNRYHLKKKLNLGKEQSLDDFVRNL
ncbi:MAG: hypothetical protein LBP67_09385 [Bacteroidales bacterium]|jgi:tetratricopeptide (TPR) repeat protein|nr:hypothetical protein [Bacteroidales bacterium]